nr:ribonuclease H-like domain-containing protein [Tanacetum cinerariifolium]
MIKPDNGPNLPKTQVVEGVTTLMPITCVEDKAQRSTLMMGIPNEHQLKFNSIKDAKQLMESIEKRFVNTALGVSTSGTQVNTANINNLSDDVICAFLASQPSSPQLINEDLEQIYPDDLKKMDLRWQMAMLRIRARRFLKKTRRKLTVNGNDTICFDKSNVECYNSHKRGHFAKECRAPRSQDTKHKKSTRRTMPMETPASTALVSCDETVKMLKSHNEQLTKDLKKSELMVLGYKSGLESVEERIKFFKTNKSIYLEDIRLLKVEIQMKGIAITKLRRKLDLAQKEKDNIQLTIDKLENTSKSLNKLIICHIVVNCKKGLGYENYNAVPPPYTGNFMLLKPDLSFTGLDEFANKPVVENCDAKTSETKPKEVRKNNDAPIIKECVSDDEEEEVTQPKIKQKIVKPNILIIEFVKPKQSKKKARKTIKQIMKKLMEDMLHLEVTPNEGKLLAKSSQDDGFQPSSDSGKKVDEDPRQESKYQKSSQDDGFQPSSDSEKKVDEDPRQESKCEDQDQDDNVNNTNNVNAASTNGVNIVSENISNELPFDPNMPALEDISTFNFSGDYEDDDEEDDMNNIDTKIQVRLVPTRIIHKDHPLDQVIGDLHSTTQTRNMSNNLEEHSSVCALFELPSITSASAFLELSFTNSVL